MTAPIQTPNPVPNRPLSLFDMADGAFAILRSRPRTVVGICASFVLPILLINTWLERAFYAGLDFGDFNSESGQFEGGDPFENFGVFGGSWTSAVLKYLLLPFLGVALTHLVAGWKDGFDRGIKDCLLFTVKKTHIIVAIFVLGKLIQTVSLMFATPAVMLLAPIVAAEGLGPFAAVRRAFQLSRRRYGQLLGLLCLVVLINVLLFYATLTIPTIGAFLLGDWGWVAYFALASVGETLFAVLGAGVAVLAYFDLLNRTEGDDLTRRLRVIQQRV